jgi:hypothetical protein
VIKNLRINGQSILDEKKAKAEAAAKQEKL